MAAPVRLTPEQRALVDANLGLAQKAAHRFMASLMKSRTAAANLGEVDFDEVLAAAYSGLVSAATRFQVDYHPAPDEKYDPALAFAGYAKGRINGSLLDWQRSVDYLQREIRTDYKKIMTAGFKTFKTTDREVALIAEKSGLPPDRVRQVLRSVVTGVPLSTEHHDEESRDWGDNGGTVESSAFSAVLQSSVAIVIATLEPVQQTILAMRYFDGKELRSIATELGLPPTTVRAFHDDAVLILHAEMLRQAQQSH